MKIFVEYAEILPIPLAVCARLLYNNMVYYLQTNERMIKS